MFKSLASYERILRVFPLVGLLSIGMDSYSISKSTLSLSFLSEAPESLSK